MMIPRFRCYIKNNKIDIRIYDVRVSTGYLRKIFSLETGDRGAQDVKLSVQAKSNCTQFIFPEISYDIYVYLTCDCFNFQSGNGHFTEKLLLSLIKTLFSLLNNNNYIF